MKKNSSSLTVSTIIPIYNSEKYLGEAIESVLCQTHPVDEIIIVNDGSTDNGPQIAESFGGKVKIIHRENGGIGAARNTGISLATGSLITFLDADDLWLPEKTQQQHAMLQTGISDMVFGVVEQFMSPELTESQCPAQPAAMKMEGYIAGAMMVSKEVFMQVGPFPENNALGEFIDWYCRAKELSLRMTMSDSIVLHRRIHQHNTTRLWKDSRKDYLDALRQKLSRERTKHNDN